MCTVLLGLGAGCPETWGREGTIERAARQDWQEWMARGNCKLSEEEWGAKCENYKPAQGNKTQCLTECRPSSAEQWDKAGEAL